MASLRFRTIFAFLLASALTLTVGCVSSSGSDSGNDSSNSNSNNSSSEPEFTLPLPSQESFSRTVSFCGTADPDDNTMANLSLLFEQHASTRQLQRSADSLAREEVTIPVYFHVISKGPSFDEGEVPDGMLIEQVEVLNRAFSGITGGVPTPFRFHLAGINRVRNAEWHVMEPGSGSELAAKEALKIGGAETLNFYLVDIQAGDLLGGQEGIILGYTTLPIFYALLGPFDGIVMHYKAVPGGPITHYNLGHVGVHETGHWLGLMHTFQGECDGFFDDLIFDTPREKTPTQGQFCPAQLDSCPELEGNDPVHNHMTYTGDECRTEFTEGQVEFMKFNAMLFRNMAVF